MYGLLRRTALTVDRDTGNVLRKSGRECRGAGDVAGLGSDVVKQPRMTSSMSAGSKS